MKRSFVNLVMFIFLLIVILFKDRIYLFASEDIQDYSSSLNKYVPSKVCLNVEEDFYVYKNSKILYRDIYNFQKKISIYYGKKDGINEGSAVVDENALLGIVSKVYDNYSEVELLTNENINLSVKVNNVFGILKYQNDTAIITNISEKVDLSVGDLIYTSGLGNLNENIFIGTIEKAFDDFSYVVNLSANFSNINYVAVIKGVK